MRKDWLCSGSKTVPDQTYLIRVGPNGLPMRFAGFSAGCEDSHRLENQTWQKAASLFSHTHTHSLSHIFIHTKPLTSTHSFTFTLTQSLTHTHSHTPIHRHSGTLLSHINRKKQNRFKAARSKRKARKGSKCQVRWSGTPF